MNTTTRTAQPDIAMMAANILTHWDEANEAIREQGAQWYDEAHTLAATLSAQTGLSIDTAAAVIAHLSPQARWAQNVAGATSLMLTRTAPGMMQTSIRRALDAMDADDPLATLHGPKTRNFAANILGDTEAVTVDIWALRVALGNNVHAKVIDRKGWYQAVADAYRMAARSVGVSPVTMQATTWIVARNGRAN